MDQDENTLKHTEFKRSDEMRKIRYYLFIQEIPKKIVRIAQ